MQIYWEKKKGKVKYLTNRGYRAHEIARTKHLLSKYDLDAMDKVSHMKHTPSTKQQSDLGGSLRCGGI